MLRVGELGKTLQIDRRPHGDVLVVDRLPVDVTIGAAHVLHAQKKAERHDGRCRDLRFLPGLCPKACTRSGRHSPASPSMPQNIARA